MLYYCMNSNIEGVFMRKIRQFCALLLAGIALCSSITACDTLPQGTSSFSSFTDSEDSSSLGGHYQDRDDDSSSWNGDSSDSSTDSSSWNDSSSDSTDSSYDSSSSADDADDLKEQQEIVDMAYALNKGDYLGGTYSLTGTITKIDDDYRFSIEIAIKGRESKPIYCYNLQGDDVSKLRIGDEATVCGRLKNYNGLIEFDSGCILEDYRSDLPDGSGDPYVSVVKSEFYENYTPAANAADAYYRTQHGLLSGNNVVPDQAPTLSAYQPKASDGSFIRNSDMRYDDEENTYVVVDAYGNEAFRVYRYGAYITLEEVAAFVYAFGTYPANYTTSKNTKPTSSVWGEYLRLNHTAFSGDTSAYPYEPILPNISGCGGDLHYYEMDIGTTGTDCDPSYPSKLYNNGSTITRGAARIVYGKEDLNGNGVYERGEFHVFYTYNHYNDFQEYLNYQGGWGEKFGNITGGGTISSKKDYNPTDYVEVTLAPLVTTLLLRMPIYAQTANAYYAF